MTTCRRNLRDKGDVMNFNEGPALWGCVRLRGSEIWVTRIKTTKSTHVTGCSDLVDLWVILRYKAYDPLRAQHVEITWSEHETRITQREHARGFFYSQNEKIVMMIKHGRHEKFTRCAKVCGPFFFLIVLFGRWLAGQATSNHMDDNRQKGGRWRL